MKHIQAKDIKKYVFEGLLWSVLWTIFLTPYSIFVEELSLWQFFYWMCMEFVLVLPLAPVVNCIGRKISKRVLK